MNKQELVQALMNAAFNCITDSELRDHFEKIIFGNHFDHPKVKLPREVGEELDQFAARYADVLQFAYHLYALSATEFPALVNWTCSAERRWVIIDAYRYGWEAEPEELFYVQTPKEWWARSNTPEYIDYEDSFGISGGLHYTDYAAKFTRAELKQYHLDSDIFTLVPVEEEK